MQCKRYQELPSTSKWPVLHLFSNKVSDKLTIDTVANKRSLIQLVPKTRQLRRSKAPFHIHVHTLIEKMRLHTFARLSQTACLSFAGVWPWNLRINCMTQRCSLTSLRNDLQQTGFTKTFGYTASTWQSKSNKHCCWSRTVLAPWSCSQFDEGSSSSGHVVLTRYAASPQSLSM